MSACIQGTNRSPGIHRGRRAHIGLRRTRVMIGSLLYVFHCVHRVDVEYPINVGLFVLYVSVPVYGHCES